MREIDDNAIEREYGVYFSFHIVSPLDFAGDVSSHGTHLTVESLLQTATTTATTTTTKKKKKKESSRREEEKKKHFNTIQKRRAIAA